MTLADVLIWGAVVWLVLGLVAWIYTTIVEGARLERQGPRRKHPDYRQAALSALLMCVMGPFAWIIVLMAHREWHR